MMHGDILFCNVGKCEQMEHPSFSWYLSSTKPLINVEIRNYSSHNQLVEIVFVYAVIVDCIW